MFFSTFSRQVKVRWSGTRVAPVDKISVLLNRPLLRRLITWMTGIFALGRYSPRAIFGFAKGAR